MTRNILKACCKDNRNLIFVHFEYSAITGLRKMQYKIKFLLQK